MDNILEGLSKLELKQVNLSDPFNRKIYLYKIIQLLKSHCFSLENYINDIGEPLAKESQIKTESADLYFDLLDRHLCYIFNVLGDMQDTSISYKKYHTICQKKNYPCITFSQDEENFLSTNNKQRNFSNHIPEALLVEDIAKIKNDKKLIQKGNSIFSEIGVVRYEYVEKSYFIERHESAKKLYFGSMHMLECAIKDLELLCNTDVILCLVKAEIQTSESGGYVQRAAENASKIHYKIPDSWIDYEDD